jgi:hypothetical protein
VATKARDHEEVLEEKAVVLSCFRGRRRRDTLHRKIESRERASLRGVLTGLDILLPRRAEIHD